MFCSFSVSLAYRASETQVFNYPVRLPPLLHDCHHPSLTVYDDLDLKAASLYMGYQAYLAKMRAIRCFTASLRTILFLAYPF